MNNEQPITEDGELYYPEPRYQRTILFGTCIGLIFGLVLGPLIGVVFL